MEIAVNETLSRTVITAFTVFLASLALFLWGGEVLDFSFAMLVGIVFGTYSSVYVASALALDTWIALDRRKGVQAGVTKALVDDPVVQCGSSAPRWRCSYSARSPVARRR